MGRYQHGADRQLDRSDRLDVVGQVRIECDGDIGTSDPQQMLQLGSACRHEIGGDVRMLGMKCYQGGRQESGEYRLLSGDSQELTLLPLERRNSRHRPISEASSEGEVGHPEIQGLEQKTDDCQMDPSHRRLR